ncbi:MULTISPECIES: glycosyltransferase [unclassified Spirosoma]|uniref:glycosyltransferase n=1 Tax=unclassified Spirosoma TaxID=2621999 RepID=UPI001ACBBB13|nr:MULTISPECIES: glycosyltransferase [unclassified Spirosoma]MBN8822516.1 glycosyltransferase [Spirosoma sp.]
MLPTSSNSCRKNFPVTHAPAWVTVICICYNHRKYVKQALQSVLQQTYLHIELIVIDNGSSDDSDEQISSFIEQHPSVRFIKNTTNLGLNRAFNQGLSTAKGSYIIDLSADDVLLPDRVAKQVALFEQLPDFYGVVFSNACFINAAGKQTGTHYPVDSRGYTTVQIPTGDVFGAVLASYFICTPTMLIRRSIFDRLGGYDEALSYEDFDFWVRSSRFCHYAYLDEVLTLKRELPDSLSSQILQRRNQLLPSTLIVCQKAFELCQTTGEFDALAGRLSTFIRKAFYTEQFALVHQFYRLLKKIRQPDKLTRWIVVLSYGHLPINYVYRLYHRYWRNPFGAFMVTDI